MFGWTSSRVPPNIPSSRDCLHSFAAASVLHACAFVSVGAYLHMQPCSHALMVVCKLCLHCSLQVARRRRRALKCLHISHDGAEIVMRAISCVCTCRPCCTSSMWWTTSPWRNTSWFTSTHWRASTTIWTPTSSRTFTTSSMPSQCDLLYLVSDESSHCLTSCGRREQQNVDLTLKVRRDMLHFTVKKLLVVELVIEHTWDVLMWNPVPLKSNRRLIGLDISLMPIVLVCLRSVWPSAAATHTDWIMLEPVVLLSTPGQDFNVLCCMFWVCSPLANSAGQRRLRVLIARTTKMEHEALFPPD